MIITLLDPKQDFFSLFLATKLLRFIWNLPIGGYPIELAMINGHFHRVNCHSLFSLSCPLLLPSFASGDCIHSLLAIATVLTVASASRDSISIFRAVLTTVKML